MTEGNSRLKEVCAEVFGCVSSAPSETETAPLPSLFKTIIKTDVASHTFHALCRPHGTRKGVRRCPAASGSHKWGPVSAVACMERGDWLLSPTPSGTPHRARASPRPLIAAREARKQQEPRTVARDLPAHSPPHPRQEDGCSCFSPNLLPIPRTSSSPDARLWSSPDPSSHSAADFFIPSPLRLVVADSPRRPFFLPFPPFRVGLVLPLRLLCPGQTRATALTRRRNLSSPTAHSHRKSLRRPTLVNHIPPCGLRLATRQVLPIRSGNQLIGASFATPPKENPWSQGLSRALASSFLLFQTSVPASISVASPLSSSTTHKPPSTSRLLPAHPSVWEIFQALPLRRPLQDYWSLVPSPRIWIALLRPPSLPTQPVTLLGSAHRDTSHFTDTSHQKARSHRPKVTTPARFPSKTPCV